MEIFTLMRKKIKNKQTSESNTVRHLFIGIYKPTVSARLCPVVLLCCHMSIGHTDVLFERINDDDDDFND